jgi:hypothetical protein
MNAGGSGHHQQPDAEDDHILIMNACDHMTIFVIRESVLGSAGGAYKQIIRRNWGDDNHMIYNPDHANRAGLTSMDRYSAAVNNCMRQTDRQITWRARNIIQRSI